jgi:hypothetical protein
MKQSEREIYHLFNGYAKDLYDRRLNMFQEISDWSNVLIGQIQSHVQEQYRLLDQEYQNQERYLREKRNEFIETALIHEQKRDNEQIYQLIKQCNALKFELAVFEFPERVIPFIEVNQASQKQQNERDAQRAQDNMYGVNSSGNYASDNGNNTNKFTSTASTVISQNPQKTT